mgnify:CR=1 FL=1
MRDLSLFDMDDPEWLSLLRTEVERPGKSIASVAREIGMPRPSLSLLLNGNYPAKMGKKQAKFAAKVFRLYGADVFCPHVKKGIAKGVCKAHYTAPLTTNSAEKLAQYMSCSRCENNPNKQPASEGADHDQS